MEARIFSSSMNHPKSACSSKYRQAFEYLKGLDKNKWHEFSEIPSDISFEVIDILDRGYNALHKVFFDNNCQCFMLGKF